MKIRHVITGGTSVGKTSVLKELKKLGYPTVREIAMELIEKKGLHPVDDFIEFETNVIKAGIKDFHNVKKGTSFFDRALPSSIAFYRWAASTFEEWKHLQMEEWMIEPCTKLRYDKIFLIEPLPKDLYEQIPERPMTYEQSLDIHHFVEEVYLEQKYEIIKVPFMTIKERTDFVLENI